jgi:hypothetical protein
MKEREKNLKCKKNGIKKTSKKTRKKKLKEKKEIREINKRN